MATNYDRIRNMSVEEMAKFIYGFCKRMPNCWSCPLTRICPECEDIADFKQWLESEVNE